MHLWRPKEIGVFQTEQLIEPLREALRLMKADPLRFAASDSPTDRRLYKNFIPWIEKYLAVCEKFPAARVRVRRSSPPARWNLIHL